jgi:DNA-binding transcriptional LysR family regulator
VNDLNSQQIDYFLSAAQHLNFTKASLEHYTSQPTISRQISLLEEELGFKLFTRYNGTLALTAGGAIMAQEFRKVKKRLNESIDLAVRANNSFNGKLSIGYLNHFNTNIYVYPPAIEFAKAYTDVTVKIESASFSQLRNRLAKGEYDIIFTYSFELRSLDYILYENCYAVSMMIAMSRNHPLAEKEGLQLSDFSGQKFLLPEPAESAGRASELFSICRSLGVEDIEVVNVSNVDSMMFGVRAGIGVALLSSANDCIYDDKYYCFPIPNSGLEPFITVAWEMNNFNPMIPLFIEFLKKSTAINNSEV